MANRVRIGRSEAECLEDERGVRWVSDDKVLESSLNHLLDRWYPEAIRSFTPDPARMVTQTSVNELNAQLLELDPKTTADRDVVY